MDEQAGIDGYLADDAYPSAFQRQFAPPWIDAMLRHRGLAPPRGARTPFRMLDIGCGDGLGLVALAAAHPEGEFLGIDGLAAHVEGGDAVASQLGLTNIRFECVRFADVTAPASADFDYVTGQGLLAWISAENRQHVYRIAADHVRPGGVVCLGYNAMPMWRQMHPFQKLTQLLADTYQGTPFERFSAAVAQVKSIGAAGAVGLPPWLIEWIDGQVAKLPGNYFAHEYLNRHWTPLWSADVIAAMAERGLSYCAASRLERLRLDFLLTRAQREQLARIDEPLARETAIDIFADASFRADIYGRGIAAAANPIEARLDAWWAATAAEADAEFSWKTAAGTLRFDNDAAHAILCGLADGPRTLRGIHQQGEGGTVADILNTADVLAVSGQIIPVDPPAPAPAPPAAADANAEFLARIAAGVTFDCLIGPHGAIPVPHAKLAPEPERQMLTRFAISLAVSESGPPSGQSGA